MDFLPRPYVPYRTAFRPLTTGTNRRINFADDTFLQENPVCGIFLPPLAYGTDFTPEGQSVDQAVFNSATLTIYSKQELILDNISLRSLIPTANAQQIPYLFTKPIAIDFTRSFVQDNTTGVVWGAAARIIPMYYYYMPAEDYAEWDAKRRIADADWRTRAKQLQLMA